MGWWERPLDRPRRRFATGETPTPAQHPGRVAPATGTPATAPRRTRGATSRRCSAPSPTRSSRSPSTTGSADSLTSFADPSFLAPLSHRRGPVGRRAGRRPWCRRAGHRPHGGPELVVPQRAPAGAQTRVQRLATWSSPTTQLQTVRLEYPRQPEPEDAAVPEVPGAGEDAGELETAEGEPRTAASAASSTMNAGPPADDPPAADRPVVQRQATDSALDAGLLSVATAGSPSGDDQVHRSEPRAADLDALPVASPAPVAPVVEASVEVQPRAADFSPAPQAPEPDVPLATTELPVVAPVSSVTHGVATRGQSEAGEAAPLTPMVARAIQRSIEPANVPTLGVGAASAPLALLSQPTTEPASFEPPVQRVRYEPRWTQPPPAGRPRPVPHVRPEPRGGAPVQRTATSEPVVAQPSREGPALPVPASSTTRGDQPDRPWEAGSGTEAGPDAGPGSAQPAGFADAHAWPDIVVSRTADVESAAAEPEPGGFTEEPLVVAWDQSAQAPAAVASSLGSQAGVKVAVAGGSPVVSTPAVQRSDPAARIGTPIVAVQRRTFEALSPAVRPDMPVPAAGDDSGSRFGPALQPPLVVARSATTVSPGGEFRPNAGREVSFAQMFSGASSTSNATPAEDVDVQREVADPPTPAEPVVQADTSDVAAAPASAGGAGGSSGAPGLGGAGGNLDEIARRLYEPLAARLREELWLDRERAGLMSDV